MSTAVAPGDDYISYLEGQLEKSDHERLLVVQQMEGLSKHFNEMASLRNALGDSQFQISVLQQQLSQEGLLVQEEREKVARLMDENAVLNAQSDDDRAKIASLIRLRRGEFGLAGTSGLHSTLVSPTSPPVGGTEGFFGNHLHKPTHSLYQDKLQEKQRAANGNNNAVANNKCIPVAHVPIKIQNQKKGSAVHEPIAKPTNSMSLRSIVTDYANTHPHAQAAFYTDACLMGKENGAGDLAGGHDAEVLAALQSPIGSTLVSALSTEVETLKKLLDEQRRAYEHERARRLQEERRRQDMATDKDREQVKLIAQLQEEMQVSVRELVMYRHQQQIVERALRAEIEMLKVSCLETHRSATHMSQRKTRDLALALEMATTKSQDQVAKLRNEMAEKRAAHFAEKESLLAAVVKLREENDKLQKDLTTERTARRKAEERCRFEKQGAQSDVGLLKHHLRAIEKKLYFSQIKGERQEASSAQLIATLMAQQAAAQRAIPEDAQQN